MARTPEQWAKLIRKDLAQAIGGLIKAGQHLNEAKLELGHGNFLAMLQQAKIHERTAQRLMKIADNLVLADPANANVLPASMRTLYELATFPESKLKQLIADGIITIETERSEVEALQHPEVKEPQHSEVEEPQRGGRPSTRRTKTPPVRARTSFTESEIRDMSKPEPEAAAKLREALQGYTMDAIKPVEETADAIKPAGEAADAIKPAEEAAEDARKQETLIDELKARIAELERLRELAVADQEEGNLHCSFCSKSQHEVTDLIIAGAGSNTCICNKCVDLCVDTIAEQRAKRAAEATAEKTTDEPQEAEPKPVRKKPGRKSKTKAVTPKTERIFRPRRGGSQ